MAPYEPATLAKELTTTTVIRQNACEDQLVIHSDRGPIMVSKTIRVIACRLGRGRLIRSGPMTILNRSRTSRP